MGLQGAMTVYDPGEPDTIIFLVGRRLRGSAGASGGEEPVTLEFRAAEDAGEALEKISLRSDFYDSFLKYK